MARVNRRGCAYTAPEPKISGKDHPFFLYPTISELIDIFRDVQAGRPIDLRTPTTHKTRASTRTPNTQARNEPNSHHRGDRGEDPVLLTFLRSSWCCSVCCISFHGPHTHRCSAREPTGICLPRRTARSREGRDLSPSLSPWIGDETPRDAAAGRNARLSVARLAATEQLAARSRGVVRCGALPVCDE
jgi:hypothetical protein